MENEVQNAEAGLQNQESAAIEPVDSSPASEPTEAAPSAPAAPVEKMIPQSQVSKIAAREAREAAERATAQAQAQFEREKAAWQQSQPPAQSIGGVQQQTPDQIRQLIMEQAMLMSRQHMAQEIERSYKGKIAAEMQDDPEFVDLYDEIGIERHPELVIMLNEMDNTGKIIKDLAQNPSKFANVLMLTRSGAPELAKRELMKLSNSIKANVEALKQPKADEPLSQLRPSNIGADNGDMSVSDFRKMFPA